jgi:hypothetical protein
VNRLSSQCGILNISQPYRPPQSVTKIALLCYLLRCTLSVDVGEEEEEEKRRLMDSVQFVMTFPVDIYRRTRITMSTVR